MNPKYILNTYLCENIPRYFNCDYYENIPGNCASVGYSTFLEEDSSWGMPPTSDKQSVYSFVHTPASFDDWTLAFNYCKDYYRLYQYIKMQNSQAFRHFPTSYLQDKLMLMSWQEHL